MVAFLVNSEAQLPIYSQQKCLLIRLIPNPAPISFLNVCPTCSCVCSRAWLFTLLIEDEKGARLLERSVRFLKQESRFSPKKFHLLVFRPRETALCTGFGLSSEFSQQETPFYTLQHVVDYRKTSLLNLYYYLGLNKYLIKHQSSTVTRSAIFTFPFLNQARRVGRNTAPL